MNSYCLLLAYLQNSFMKIVARILRGIVKCARGWTSVLSSQFPSFQMVSYPCDDESSHLPQECRAMVNIGGDVLQIVVTFGKLNWLDFQPEANWRYTWLCRRPIGVIHGCLKVCGLITFSKVSFSHEDNMLKLYNWIEKELSLKNIITEPNSL